MSDKARKKAKARECRAPLPMLYVEMKYEGGHWYWSDVRLDNPPSYQTTELERAMGYRIVEYVPRKAGARRAR